jgi:ATP-dependent Lon protease
MKEKLLAAHRMGLRTVLLPKDNEKDLAEIPQEILSSLKLHFVETVDEVLQIALERPIVPLEHIGVAPVTDALAGGADKDKSLTN